MITLVLSAVILRYYITEYGETREAIKEQAVTGARETEGTFAGAEDRMQAAEKDKGQPAAEKESQMTEEAVQTAAEETAQEAQKVIRVLIKTDDFLDIFHRELEITGTGAFRVVQGEDEVTYPSGTVFSAQTFFDSKEASDEIPVILSPVEPDGRLQVLNLVRNESPPAYLGTLEISRQENGYLLINELPLEEYLPSVLSSEMSGGFPSEALKAQAVSARTYALKCIREAGGSCHGADLDDSVSYQVYNNMPGDAATRQAVEDTAGLVLEKEGKLADVSYFSTSSGVTPEDFFETEEEFRQFIQEGRDTDLEREEPWYRWSAQITSEQIRNNLLNMGLEAPGTVTGIAVTERDANGQARELEILGENSSLHIAGEYDIRQTLSPGTAILLQDGSSCAPMQLLPSAWFVIDRWETGEETAETEEDSTAEPGWKLTGGGFGHGNGMSQNGARIMASQGKTFREILEFYYPGTQVLIPEDR